MSDPSALKEFVRLNSKKSVPTPNQGRDNVKTDYITQVFRNADKDNSGRLTKVEFQQLLKELGLGQILESDPSFKSWDINQDEEIDYEGNL